MQFGINTFLFTFPFTNKSAKLFPQFKAWGFDSVEIAIDDPAGYDPHFIRAALDRSGLACNTVCGAFGPDRDLRGTPEQQQNSLNYMMAMLDQMEVLGAKILAGPVYSAVGRAEAVPPREYTRQWKTVVRHLKRLCDYAGEKGMRIAVEPLNRFETDFLNTVDATLSLIADVDSPAIGLHYDTFHMNIEEKFQDQAIRRAGDRLIHFHACGCDRGTPGHDHIDWKGIAAALRAVKYDGDVTIESFTQDVKVIARAAAIWRQIEPSREDIAVKGLAFLQQTLKRKGSKR
jgi:D-psicose/D-tagatose/L-ribulose 3-epimerase